MDCDPKNRTDHGFSCKYRDPELGTRMMERSTDFEFMNVIINCYWLFVYFLCISGECWSGPRNDTYKKVGSAGASDCVGPDYKPCLPFDRNCVGKPKINFVYKIG